MKNIIRRINVISIILITILALSTQVKAANDSYKTTLSANHSQVHRGEDVTITIGLSNIAIESGEKGIGAYTANIEFDSSIFEYSKTEGTEIWEEPFYQDKMIIAATKDCKVVNTAQDIGTITLKVKDTAKLGETTIKLTNFSGSNAVSDIPTSDTSVKVTILDKNDSSEGGNSEDQDNENGNGGSGNNENQGNETENGENQNGNNENQNGNNSNQNNENSGSQNSGNGSSNNGSQSGNSSNINNASKDDVKQGVIPQTGDIDITRFTLISLFTVVAISLLIRMKLLDKKIKKNQWKKD